MQCEHLSSRVCSQETSLGVLTEEPWCISPAKAGYLQTTASRRRNYFKTTMPSSSTLILSRGASAEFQWAGGVGTGSLLLT